MSNEIDADNKVVCRVTVPAGVEQSEFIRDLDRYAGRLASEMSASIKRRNEFKDILISDNVLNEWVRHGWGEPRPPIVRASVYPDMKSFSDQEIPLLYGDYDPSWGYNDPRRPVIMRGALGVLLQKTWALLRAQEARDRALEAFDTSKRALTDGTRTVLG
jgi:hypothetical protein